MSTLQVISELPYGTRTFELKVCESTQNDKLVKHYAVFNKETTVPEFQHEVLMVSRRWMEEVQSELDEMDGQVKPTSEDTARMN